MNGYESTFVETEQKNRKCQLNGTFFSTKVTNLAQKAVEQIRVLIVWKLKINTFKVYIFGTFLFFIKLAKFLKVFSQIL